jgi:hypothetical protein
MPRFYQPDLGSEPDSPFARDSMRDGKCRVQRRRNTTALGQHFLCFFGWQNLLGTDLINKAFALQVGQMRPLFIVGHANNKLVRRVIGWT